MNGFINLYKPSGITSAYALNMIKKKFKGVKLGHMGTLDPLACGILPIAFGKSTRLFDFLLEKEKIYNAVFEFSYETDTLDVTGTITKSGGKIPTKEEILSVLPKLIGEVDQIPPSYSAKNVNGKRSYELARKGISVELPSKKVVIHNIELIKEVKKGSFLFKITCGGGTYIRSICRDLGYELNTFATMTALERTKSGMFSTENAFTLEEITNNFNLEKMLIKPDAVLTLDKIILNEKDTLDLLNGRPFKVNYSYGNYLVYGNNEFIGVGVVIDNVLKIKAYIKD